MIENHQFIPVNIDAERAILGSVLLQPKIFADLIETVKPDDFYYPKHIHLFNIYIKLFEKYQQMDINLLKEEISTANFRDLDVAYLNELVKSACSPTMLEYYTKIVKKKAQLRKLINVCNNILSQISENGEPESLLNNLEKMVFDIGHDSANEKVNKIDKILHEVLTILDERLEGRTHLEGISTGYSELDDIVGGFAPSHYIVIAGRPGLGKTSFALNLAYNIALKNNPILFFTLEAEQQMIVHNILCSVAGVNTFSARKGNLTTEEAVELSRAADVLESLPIYVDNSKNITPFEIRLIARKCQKQFGIKAIFVDYLQLINVGTTNMYNTRIENRQQEIAFISRSLKILATELDIPVIAVAQLSRTVEAREGHRPMLSDLRESGAIEQDADIVLFLFREDYYLREQTPPEKRGICEIIVAKNRYGPTSTALLKFNLPTIKFESLKSANSMKIKI